MDDPLVIATWNVNGIRAREREVGDWLARERPHVACLQELKASLAQIPTSLYDLEGYWCAWHGEKGYSGVALLVRRDVFPHPPIFTHPVFDHEARIVEARLGTLTVVSVYVPNGGKDFPAKLRFLEALADHAAVHAASPGETLVICGDLNVARADIDVHPKERKPKAIGQLPEERELIDRLLSHGLVDVARTLEPDNEALFTWWPPWRNLRQRNIGWRIDFVLASAPLARRAARCSVFRETGTSDHGPIVATFEVSPASFVAADTPSPSPPSSTPSTGAPSSGQGSLF